MRTPVSVISANSRFKKLEKFFNNSEVHESCFKQSKGTKESSFLIFPIKSVTMPVINVPKQTDTKMYHFLSETVNLIHVLSSRARSKKNETLES